MNNYSYKISSSNTDINSDGINAGSIVHNFEQYNDNRMHTYTDEYKKCVDINSDGINAGVIVHDFCAI